MKKFKFNCGCEFDILDDQASPVKIRVPLNIDEYNFECRRTWDFLATGLNKGVFQLESRLGKTTMKRLMPQNIDHLAALVSIIRPGCLEARLDDGKNLTEHYILRKNNEEPAEAFHPAIAEILKDTYQLLIYQEQSMLIAEEIAGFTPQESDTLRKIVGKKLVEKMPALRKMFLEGCEKIAVVSEEDAKKVFDWIEKGGRYLFNRCLSLDTLVETRGGLNKTIEEVEIGESIKAPNGYTTIVDKHDNGVQELYELTLESGKTITCTLDHKFLCEDGVKHTVRDILLDNLCIICDGE